MASILTTSRAPEEASPEVAPAGARVVLYACVPTVIDPGRALRATERFALDQGWAPVALFLDRALVTGCQAERCELPRALGFVQDGEAAGIVAPSVAMLWYYAEDRESLARWQATTGAFVATPASLAAVRLRIPRGFRDRPKALGIVAKVGGR
ncbi:hypothetical protein [Streptomyces sp. H27-D2]|uniref:hypothetical protein n=1 Tax=Streptomyces sp. H27-D2 TaxID=3046304 RepID=UPI002DB6E21E|nr:hypothetical protein [Streptomyces sp. H27-D2]MEC4019702.1 hypothetical protein [Streptomyces sp. H27-D2]